MTNRVDSCPIWGTQASGHYDQRTRVWHIEESPRAGGGYILDQVLNNSELRQISQEQKARLTTWLIDQRTMGDEQPQISKDIIERVKTRNPLPVYERADRLLRSIASQGAFGEYVEVSPEKSLTALAWSESTRWEEVYRLLGFLQQKEWLYAGTFQENMFKGYVTVDGHSRIGEQRVNADSTQAFVAMWFDESMTESYVKGIQPAIEDAGYKPRRIDDKEHINKIEDEIIAEIRRSRFLVADFTHGRGGARGGVYYEAGFAQGLGLPVIFTCRKSHVKKLHFDTSHYNHIVWETPDDLREKLTNRILAVMGEGPGVHTPLSR